MIGKDAGDVRDGRTTGQRAGSRDTVILFATNVDTEILALRTIVEGLPAGFPNVRAVHLDRLDGPVDLEGVGCVVSRVLGGNRAPGFARLRSDCISAGVPLVACGGEAVPDAELAASSTAPAGIVAEAFRYLVAGGPANLGQLLRFVSDTVLRTGFGFTAPEAVPDSGIWDGAGLGRSGARHRPERPLIGVVFYRAHLIAGNTRFVVEICDAIEVCGCDAVAMYCYSLRTAGRGAPHPLIAAAASHGVDALVTTVLAMGGASHGAGTTGGAGGLGGEGWDVGALAALGVPVVQAPVSSQPARTWAGRASGLGPVDVAMGVAGCELDGRVIAPVFAFKELVDDGDDLGTSSHAYRTLPDRALRVAEIAARFGRLHNSRLHNRAPGARRIAIVLSAYPTRRSRIGNAVGLDTPASTVDLLHMLRATGRRVTRVPGDGDALMGELAAALLDDASSPAGRSGDTTSSMDASAYTAWFATLPDDARDAVVRAWGQPPGSLRVAGDRLVFSGIDLGDVLVAVQPPRGFGDDPSAVYHSPTLPPTHHYLAFYRWLDEIWGADAVVHLGKHGTLEWLPGKAVGLSASCFPDAALGGIPLFYPFVVNDPGEGTQAKRRAHAVVIDHLQPPMTRAETYDDLARLEQLLDEYAGLQSLDPSKLPAQRDRIWDLLVVASLHVDLGLAERPDGAAFDDLLGHVDGYLCELKDAQIRGGLHVLGRAPSGPALVDTILAATRLAQGRVPSLRAVVAAELGVDLARGRRHEVDRVEARCRDLVEAAAERGWKSAPGDLETLTWVCDHLVPALGRTGEELANLASGLAGGFVPPGPSGALTRGGAHVLPTGRNFYSLDPRAIPTELSWQVGQDLAAALLQRHLDEDGCYPRTVGIVLWGTAAMRTQGDDVAEVLALLGVRPVWEPESRRVAGVEPVPLAELGRPRVDVTVRISGFFRDAFSNLVALIDDAVALAASLEEPEEDNAVRAAGTADPRVFGPAPGSYGSGILSALESGNWHGDDDLAAIYMAWSGHSYGRDGFGAPAPDAMRRRFSAIEVAVKNQDNREHDIFDSDDYLQDHGGMIATVRALAGRAPKALFGDSSDPTHPKVRALAEEAARVVRTRVLNPRWIDAMAAHGYKGAFEMAATVDYLFGYDATAHVVEDWMYEKVVTAYVEDPAICKFFEQSNPWARRAICEKLLDASERGMWDASPGALATLRAAVLEAEGWEESR